MIPGETKEQFESRTGSPPRVGLTVLYTNLGDKDGKYPPEQQAAIITRVRDGLAGTVALHIFYPTGQFDMDNVPYADTYERGHWTFAPRD